MPVKLLLRGNVYYARYTDAVDGRRRMERLSTDKRVAEQLARKIEDEQDRIRGGWIDEKDLAYRDHAAKALVEHLEDFRRALVAKGDTAKHAQVTAYRARRVIELMKARRISDLSLSGALEALQSLRAREKFNQQTINHYIRAVKAFSRWLWKDKRAREHHLAHLATADPEPDRRYIRRALTPEEAIRVIQAAEAGPTVMGMSGADRAALYAVARRPG
jgi:hypothetical protein